MTLSYWQRGAHEPEVRCEIAVVGGGVIGCATAYWLRRLQPDVRVVIVEAGRLASGASGRNAGFLLQGTAQDYGKDVEAHGRERARRLWQFTKENRDLIFSMLPGRLFNLASSGSLTVAGTPEEDMRLQESVAHLRADGIPVAYIPAAETNRRLVAHGFFGALFVTSNACLDPVRLVRHLAAESGAQVLEHHPVVAVSEKEGRVWMETTTRIVQAQKIVLALGAYLPQLYPALGRYVRPVRAQMLVTEPAQARWLQVPVYSHEGYFYLRQAPDAALLLGGARHLHVREEVGYEDAVTPALQEDLERYLHAYFPQTRGLRVQHRWSGVMGFSPDRLPVLGALPGLEGSVWATGFTGHGMGYGFRFGRLLAERVLGFPHPEGYDLFAAERFAQQTPRDA